MDVIEIRYHYLDDSLEPDFRAMIQKEGVTLYEKI